MGGHAIGSLSAWQWALGRLSRLLRPLKGAVQPAATPWWVQHLHGCNTIYTVPNQP
jgi:hypothetical protein